MIGGVYNSTRCAKRMSALWVLQDYCQPRRQADDVTEGPAGRIKMNDAEGQTVAEIHYIMRVT